MTSRSIKEIHLEHAIKALGEHEVELRLHAEVKSTLKVRVESLTPITAPVVETAPAETKTEKRGKRPERAEAAEEKPKSAKDEKPAKTGKAPKAEKKAKSE